MGDATNSGSGLIFRTAKYFNNEGFSDLEFLVKDSSGYSTFYAHKLILAMASENFAALLHPKKDAPDKIKITDFSPKIVYVTLQYLYTDVLNLTSINEAMDVFRLASKFGIKDLADKCKDYIGLDKITEDNLFIIYDIALKGNIKDMLLNCQDFACRKTQAVFDSVQFCEASVEVLTDILNQNSLAVEKEMDVINAVLHWCRRDCEKRKRPFEPLCIRDSISQFLPYLRFLTLSVDEFLDFVDKHSIFTNSESVMLTRKILDPISNSKVPTGFCLELKPRGIVKNNVRSDTIRGIPLKINVNIPEQKPILKFGKTSPLAEMSLLGLATHQDRTYTNALLSQFDTATPSVPSYEVRNENVSMRQKPLFQFSVEAKKSPTLKVMHTSSSNSKRYFDFPLQAMQKGMSSVFKRDLICSAEVRVSRGAMVIFGVDLRVQGLPQSVDESIKVCLSISGDVPEKNSISSVKLINNVAPLIFSEPLLLNNNSAKIEITIEDLKLNRCNICKETTYQLNGGLNLATVINLKSNQSNEAEGFFFLISRIIYS